MKRILLLLALLCVAHGVTSAQRAEPKLEGYLTPDGQFLSMAAAAGAPTTLVAKYLQMYASAPTCSRKGQMYYDTVLNKQRVCTATPSTWETVLSGTSAAAPLDATYITQTTNSTLTNEQAMGSLATGLVKNATTTGIQSIATAGTDYLDPTHLTGSPYDVAASFDGAPAANATIRVVVPRAFNSGASFIGTICSAGTAATAQTDFLVKVNGTTKATLRFAASGTTCSIVGGTTTSLVATDVITIIAPGSADATLADIAISIKGSLP